MPAKRVIQKPMKERLIDPLKPRRAVKCPRKKFVAMFEHPTLCDRVSICSYNTEDELTALKATCGNGIWYQLSYDQAGRLSCVELDKLLNGRHLTSNLKSNATV